MEGLKSICVVQRTSTKLTTGKTTTSRRYFISSLPLGPQEIARCVREHWDVENSCHWSLDVIFNALRVLPGGLFCFLSPGWGNLPGHFSGNRTVSPQKERQGTGRGSESPQIPRRPSAEHKKQPRFCVVFDRFRGCSCYSFPNLFRGHFWRAVRRQARAPVRESRASVRFPPPFSPFSSIVTPYTRA